MGKKVKKESRIPFISSVSTKIIFVIVMILIFALQFIGANFITQIEQQLITNFHQERQNQVNYIKIMVRPYLESLHDPDSSEEVDPQTEINNLINDYSGSLVTKLSIIDTDSTTLALSDNTSQGLVGQLTDDDSARNAVIQGQSTSQQIIDPATNERRYKVTEPVYSSEDNSTIIGAVNLESNIETVYSEVDEITIVFIQASLLAIVISLILANIVSRAFTKPIIEMQEQTKKIADGDYSGALTVYGSDELGKLSALINDLSDDVSSAQESIESERRRLDSVLTNMTDGVLATDRRGKITIVNPMGERLLNVTKEEIENEDIRDVLKIDNQVKLRSLVTTDNERLIETGEMFEGLLLRATFSAIQRDSGFISGYVCVLHDVTEQQRINDERKQFVSNVSHELRTPLTSMRSYIEALADGAWENPELAPRFLKVTQDETDRMIRMVQDLLHLSRIDTGKSQLNLEMIDIKELFDRVLSRFDMLINSNEYSDKTYSIDRQIMDETVFVEIDTDRFIQVLDNIMNNAIKYSPDGSKITGRIKHNKYTNRVEISITDQGIGIPQSDLNKVFSRFYRVDKARSRAMGGSGLGLAISKEVVEQHGGNIWVRSEENVGTTVYISLPIVPYDNEGDWA
ncbi:MAG TPA: cell wall metabolism sensor histidine kinase WalK [Alloiococcus sp.]|nr:cell wall metabolism sensor histidine kinase WalK [Alloiococcus sp.]